MKLNVKERLILLNILPSKGNLNNQTLVRDIANKIGFSDKEKKKINLRKDKTNAYFWNNKKSKKKTIDLTFSELQVLKDRVAELDKEGEITPNNLDICLKIKNAEVEKK